MKKLIVLFAVLLAALFVVACASKPPAGPSAADKLAEAKSGAPDGTLVGQGTARGTKDNVDDTKKKAEASAVSRVKMGLNSIVGQLVDDQVASGRLQSAVSTDFKQHVDTALGRISFDGVVVDSGVAADFTGWAVYSLNHDGALKAVTTAVNAAKGEVSAGNFNLNDFDAKFAAAAAKEWK